MTADRDEWSRERALQEFEWAERRNIELITQLVQLADAIRVGASQARLLERLDELGIP